MILFYLGALAVTWMGTKSVIGRQGTLGLDAPDGRRKLHEQVTIIIAATDCQHVSRGREYRKKTE